MTDKEAIIRIPGEEGIWVLIIGELVIFGIFFLMFSHARMEAPALFSESHLTLNRGLGLFNTLLLLVSSLFVAIGVHRAMAGGNGARKFLLLAMGCGLGFVAIKSFEYVEKVGAGYTLFTNDFFMYYYVFTGIHLLHVLLGLAILSWMQKAVITSDYDKRIHLIESGGIFWHLVDLLWIVLFALFYILGA